MQRVDIRACRSAQSGHGLNYDQILRTVNARHALPEYHAETCVKMVSLMLTRSDIAVAAQPIEGLNNTKFLNIA